MTDHPKLLPGPSDEEITEEVRRHQALCGSDFPDCGLGHAMRYLFAQDANRRTPSPAREDLATREIIEKSVAAMNLAAAYLWKAAEAVGASHQSDPCVYHAQRLQIASGALGRLLSLTSPPPPSKSEAEKVWTCPCGGLSDGKRCPVCQQARTAVGQKSEAEIRAEVWEEAAAVVDGIFFGSSQTAVRWREKAKSLRDGAGGKA